MHIAISSWNFQSFSLSFPQTAKHFSDDLFLICCKKDEKGKYSEFIKTLNPQPEAILFHPEEADRIFGIPSGERSGTLGHVEDIFQLSSIAMGKDEPLVFLEDDIFPKSETRDTYARAFRKYDLVAGNFEGCTGNYVHAMVFFFDLLYKSQSDFNSKSFTQKAEQFLRGVAESPEKKNAVRGISGGNSGISGKLKGKVAHAPFRKFRGEDHFFEFACKLLQPHMGYMMLGSTYADEIPAVEHRSFPGGKDALVNKFISDVRSSTVVKYLYFRTLGHVPKIVDGQFALSKLEEFDPSFQCTEAMKESAIAKFQNAAKHYLTKPMPEDVKAQLERIISINWEQVFVPMEELEAEWSAYAQAKDALPALAKEAQGKKQEMEKLAI